MLNKWAYSTYFDQFNLYILRLGRRVMRNYDSTDFWFTKRMIWLNSVPVWAHTSYNRWLKWLLGICSALKDFKKRQGDLYSHIFKPLTTAFRQVTIVHAIPLIVTRRSAVVFGLKICECKCPCPDVARTSLSFFGINYSGCQFSPSFVKEFNLLKSELNQSSLNRSNNAQLRFICS